MNFEIVSFAFSFMGVSGDSNEFAKLIEVQYFFCTVAFQGMTNGGVVVKGNLRSLLNCSYSIP